jgi:hypothetical protein
MYVPLTPTPTPMTHSVYLFKNKKAARVAFGLMMFVVVGCCSLPLLLLLFLAVIDVDYCC